MTEDEKADQVTEYLFQSPQPGLWYVTQNILLAETLGAADRGEMMTRLASPLPDTNEGGDDEHQ